MIMETFKREIYEKLGNLFYAIAKDQNIAPLEFGQLKMLMRKDWLGNHENTTPVTEAAHLIVITMDTLQAEETPSEQAFASFTEFYRKHSNFFSDKLKEETIITAEEIIRMFKTANRRQNNHVIKLKLLLQNSSLVLD